MRDGGVGERAWRRLSASELLEEGDAEFWDGEEEESLGNCRALMLSRKNLSSRSLEEHAGALGRLETLAVAGNALAGLGFCAQLRGSLQVLNVSGNALESLRGVEGCAALERLYCAGNALRTLEAVSRMRRLQVLVASNNALHDVEVHVLRHVRGARGLRTLDLAGNPCAEAEGAEAGEAYRRRVFRVLCRPRGSLEELDGARVGAGERSAGDGASSSSSEGEEEEEEGARRGPRRGRAAAGVSEPPANGRLFHDDFLNNNEILMEYLAAAETGECTRGSEGPQVLTLEGDDSGESEMGNGGAELRRGRRSSVVGRLREAAVRYTDDDGEDGDGEGGSDSGDGVGPARAMAVGDRVSAERGRRVVAAMEAGGGVSSGLYADLENIHRDLAALDGQGEAAEERELSSGGRPPAASRLGRTGLPPRPNTSGAGSSDGSRPGSTASAEASGPSHPGFDASGLAAAGLLRPGTASLIAEAQALSGSMPSGKGRSAEGERAGKVISALVEKLELVRRERDLLQRSQSGELNRLRQEVSVLKAESKNMYAVLEENRTLREQLKQLTARLATAREGAGTLPSPSKSSKGGASPRGIGAARSAVREELEAMRAELRSQGLSSDGPSGSSILAALDEDVDGSGSESDASDGYGLDEDDPISAQALRDQVDALEADLNVL